ncbi:MUC5AC [Branchiostoma lanceolatum]|uniref:MUC5AC protein n=1 Tax=Branchiostoma lanceolatum TaxID=7740 RepID=A0A8J9WFR9_BRALA|nr:MUC5AC [Branchiostoma lanceolatum]
MTTHAATSVITPKTTTQFVPVATTEPECTPYWTEFYNENTPTTGPSGYELETLAFLSAKYEICKNNRPIEDVQCLDVQTNKPHNETGDFASCTPSEGLICINGQNLFTNDEQCQDYKVRFLCGCEEGTTEQPTTTDGQCVPYWTEFFNENTPTEGENGKETETLQDLKEKYMICHGMLITDVECVNGTGVPYTETGDVAFCNETHGLRCFNHDNWYLNRTCDNYKVRFFCTCPPPTPSEPPVTTIQSTPSDECVPHWTEFFDENAPTDGPTGRETETLQDLREKYMICHGMPITDVECVNGAGVSYTETGDVAFCNETHGLRCFNHDNWYLNRTCDNYKVRFFCNCPTPTPVTPIQSSTSDICVPHWTEFFDESTPTEGQNGLETETLQDLREKYMICHGMPITDVECVNGTGVPYTETGDVAFCDVTEGLRCLNYDNWYLNRTCDDYKIRFYCDCPTTTTPTPTCDFWTPFFDEHTPTEGPNGYESETLQDLKEKYLICHGLPITDVECLGNNDISYDKTGDVAYCDVTDGLRCKNSDNWYLNRTCDDYKIRFYCDCPTTTTPNPTAPTCDFWTPFFDEHTPTEGPNGYESETLQDLKEKYLICHGLPITDIECLGNNDISYDKTGDVAYCNVTDGLRCKNSDNWYLNRTCDDYKVRFYCDCPTESTSQPETTVPPTCVPHWTEFFDENAPTQGENGLETETLQDLRTKYMICHGLPITDVECVDDNDISYRDTGDVAFCDVTEGLRCLNYDNWYLNRTCDDYKIRFYCDCPSDVAYCDVTDGLRCKNSDNWYLNRTCDDYKIRFYCDCPTTTTPNPTTPTCDFWTPFFDEHTPTEGPNGYESETLQDLKEKYLICHGLPITDIECLGNNDISYDKTGDVAYCNVTDGLRCKNSDNWYLNRTCDDYKVRFYCDCPTGDVAYCTTTDGFQCYNSENWFTDDKQCSNYKVRFQCGCPTTPAPTCDPHWTEFFDESTPTQGENGLETETLQDLRTKYMICHGLPITDVECVDDNGISYRDTGDVAYCTTTDGFQCHNSENWFTDDKQCSNYKVRFQCGCPGQTTGIPMTTQPLTTYIPFGNETKILIHTVMNGFNYTQNMSIEGTEDRLWLEKGVLAMIGQMFDDHLGVSINLTVISVVEGSVDVTTKVDLYESLIPTAYARILGDDWLKTVIKDELPPERYDYLISIDKARRLLDEEHGHEHTLHYAMLNCGEFVEGCEAKELCLTWGNETNCRCFPGHIDRDGHNCIDTPSPPPPEPCKPYWTPFFNTNTTTDGDSGGEVELLDNIRQNYSICADEYITDIICRKVGTNQTADELGQTVMCNNTVGMSGLRCSNSDNLDTDAGGCEDYEVSFKCGCEIEIVTSVLSSRMVGIDWSEKFLNTQSWEYKVVKEYYMRMTTDMMKGIAGIFGMRFLGITPGSVIVSAEINSTKAAVHLLRFRSLELADDFHMVPEDMANGNMYVDECEMAIDDCVRYNKTCTNTQGSYSCHCPAEQWWNETSASCVSGARPKGIWVNRTEPTSEPQQQCPDCGLGTCEYNNTNGLPFCRCPDGSTGDNCDADEVVVEGSLAALAALAAIIPCCCCLAILAARKQRKKRKLLYFIPRESLLIVAPKMTDKTTSVIDNDSAYAARLGRNPDSWSSYTDSPSFSGSDAPLFIGRYMPTPESVRRRTSNEIYRESDDESIKQYHQIFKQDRKFKLERPKFTWLPPMT